MESTGEPPTNRLGIGLTRRALIPFVTIVGLWSPLSPVAAGDLDPSFGEGGLVREPFGLPDVGGLAIQADGKILIALSAREEASERHLTLLRLTPRGRMDGSFGTGGRVRLDISSIGGIALQPDGRILVAGSVPGPFGQAEVAVGRLTPDGSPDDSFGENGWTFTRAGRVHHQSLSAADIDVDRDGRVYVAARFFDEPSLHTEFRLLAYTSNGLLDPAFGRGGVAPARRTNRDTPQAAEVVGRRVLVAGSSGSFPEAPGTDSVIAAFKPGGRLATDFGSGGWAVTDVDAVDYIADLAVDAEGRAVVTGYTSPGGPALDILLMRYTPDGAPDINFGTEGVVRLNLGGTEAGRAVAIAQDGSILVAGQQTPGSWLVLRFDSAGDLDPTFGTGGVAETDFHATSSPTAIALQRNGKIVAAGYVEVSGSTWDVVVARYLAT